MERRIQRERAVAVILEAVSFGPARGEWQNRIQPVQRLGGTLLVALAQGIHDKVLTYDFSVS
jgi:hypothetical protein